MTTSDGDIAGAGFEPEAFDQIAVAKRLQKVPPHDAYSRQIEARTKWFARQRSGQSLSISPLSVDELTETEGDKAGTGEGRSHLAAEVQDDES